MTTKSPSLQLPASACASSLVVRRMNLPYVGCLIRRSISTAMVFCILVLTTRPVRVRAPLTSTLLSSALTSCLRPGPCAAAAASSSRARCCGARPRTGRAWGSGRWRAACAARTAPCAASPTPRRAPPGTASSACRGTAAAVRSSSAHLPFHERGGHGELRARQAKRLARGHLVHALHLEEHLAGLHARHVVLDVALARAHADLEGLLGDRHVGEDADPDLAAALHVARHGAPGRLDLARRHARAARGLEAELAEGNVAAARREAAVAALELLAVLGAFGLQHGRSILTSGLRRCIRWRA